MPILGRGFRAEGAPSVLADWLRAHWYFPEYIAAPHTYTITLEVRDTPPVARAIPSVLSRVEYRRLWLGGTPLPL